MDIFITNLQSKSSVYWLPPMLADDFGFLFILLCVFFKYYYGLMYFSILYFIQFGADETARTVIIS
jgi:hypothetical protein